MSDLYVIYFGSVVKGAGESEAVSYFATFGKDGSSMYINYLLFILSPMRPIPISQPAHTLTMVLKLRPTPS